MKMLKEQPTEENPHIVNDYPYGYSLRCIMRYWIETTKRGQRSCRQSQNPKTGKWNKPKKSTYSNIMLAGLDEKGHYKVISNSMYSLKESKEFSKKYSEYFSDWQKKEMLNIIGMEEVYDKVEYSFKARKFKHKTTGEITESIPIFEMDDYVEVDEEGKKKDTEAEEKKQKEMTMKIIQTAVHNASKKTSMDSARGDF